MSINNLYKIIPISDLEGKLSAHGLTLLATARKNITNTKVIRCINHEESVIASIFKDGIDYNQIIDAYPTLTYEQAAQEMKKEEWQAPTGGDL